MLLHHFRKIVGIIRIDGYEISVLFDNGEKRTVDFKHIFREKGDIESKKDFQFEYTV